MPDLLYVGGTILFFLLMAALVRGCARIGRPDGTGAQR